MRGLFLQGGGAKGAFQAGVIYGLYEEGLSFDVLSGTSIGAINSYFIYTGNIEKLKEIWTNINIDEFDRGRTDEKIIENKVFIDILKEFKDNNEKVKAAYVNYVKVQGSSLVEEVVDITKLDKKERLEAIRFSSLLPFRLDKNKSVDEIIEEFDSQKLFEEFKQDLEKGIYDGYKLDGGILNNDFLNPFIDEKVDELYIVTFKKGYDIPEYILQNYKRNDIALIEPITEFRPNDTLRFKKDFCEKLFYEGYKISKTI